MNQIQIGRNIWVFPKIGVPQNGGFTRKNPIKMDDLGVPLFLETPIYTGYLGTTVHPASLPSAKPALRTPTLAMSFSAEATQQTVSFWLWSVLGRQNDPKTGTETRPTANYKLNMCETGMNTTHPARHLRYWKHCNYRDTYHINCFRILAISSILQILKEIWLDWNWIEHW